MSGNKPLPEPVFTQIYVSLWYTVSAATCNVISGAIFIAIILSKIVKQNHQFGQKLWSEHIFVVINEHADGLAPLDARASARTVVTELGSHMYLWEWLRLQIIYIPCHIGRQNGWAMGMYC